MNTVLMGYHCKLLHVAWLAQGEGNLSGNSIRGEKVLHYSIRLSCCQDSLKEWGKGERQGKETEKEEEGKRDE